MNQTKTVQGYWYTVLVWVAVMALCLGISARAAGVRQVSVKVNPNLPTQRHFNAASQRQECSIYSAVIHRLKGELSTKKEVLSEIKGTLAERRAELDKCAALHGLSNIIDDEDEVYLASVCGEQYDLWLTPGYSVELVRGEVKELKSDIQVALDHVRLKCPRKSFNEF